MRILNYTTPRWTLLLPKLEGEQFDETGFKVLHKKTHMFSDDYMILEIESLVPDTELSAYDILTITDALAVHEEFTNGVLVTPDSVEIIAEEIYSWNGAGSCLIGDMTTELERSRFITLYFYNKLKSNITDSPIMLQLQKDGPMIPMSDNVDTLFDNDIYAISCGTESECVWWPTFIENQGMYLIVLDESEEEEEKAMYDLVPARYSNYDMMRDYYDEVWGRQPWDEYDWDDVNGGSY